MKNIFRDRVEAGRLLASKMSQYEGRDDVIVLGLPRGGVPVAFEVAKALGLPLDVFVVRKLGVPGYPELAMGAIATGGVRVLNKEVIAPFQIPNDVIDHVTAEEAKELRRRELAYRGHGRSPAIKGRTVILVDDGIATGSTMRAAIRALRNQHAAHIVVAVPTAAASSVKEIKEEVDEVVACMTPPDFHAVCQWYLDFAQTSDAEVARLLEAAGHGGDKSELTSVQTNGV